METQAYFENIQQHIIKELHQAQQNIYIAVAWFTDREIF
jgi:phosphatidylserine/phosphatidylglycerophosphate/cardiolipin synthase-like enzyme